MTFAEFLRKHGDSAEWQAVRTKFAKFPNFTLGNLNLNSRANRKRTSRRFFNITYKVLPVIPNKTIWNKGHASQEACE